MFPFQQSDELVSQISSDPHQTQQDPVILEGNNNNYLPMDMGIRGGFSISNSDDHHQPTTCDNNNERKIMRRDNERQRRQQMTFLTASLRSLLPLEMIKGKRSVSDHMHEAVNYISHMKNKIEALTVKRDELKILPDLSVQTLENCYLNSVMVRPCLGGIEIVISTFHLPLSRVLEVLLQEGLNIVGCSSTKVNGRLIHTIQSEVEDMSNCHLDLSELQQKLYVILSSTLQ